MEWLNYHHLRYFWTVAKQGSLKDASAQLHVSQPSISAQISELEETLGEKLFRRSGRSNVLTEAGQIAFRYADEIFSLGRELVHAVKQRPGANAIRLYVGIADSFPKLVINQILHPVFEMSQKVHAICREGKVQDLLSQLAVHRLDIVFADQPAAASANLKAFNHLLGDSGLTFCAEAHLASALRNGFPRSLHDAPALLPAENTALRRSLDRWFESMRIQPRVVAQCEDAALLKVLADDGKGFIPVPTVVLNEALAHCRLQSIGTTDKCRDEYYAITAERKVSHPAVALITTGAQRLISSKGPLSS